MRFMSFVQQTISANPTKQSQNAKSSFVLLLYHCMYTSQFKQKLSSQIFTCECSAICVLPVLPVLPFEGWNLHLIRQRPLRGSPRLANESGAGDWKSELFKSTEWKDQKRQQLNTLCLYCIYDLHIHFYNIFVCVYVCKHIFNMYDSPPWKKWGCSRLVDLK